MTSQYLFDDLYRDKLAAPAPVEQAAKLARRDGPATSQAAAREAVASGPIEQREKFENDCKRLLEGLRMRPLFNYELPQFAGLNPRARVSDLRNAGFHIECRKCTSAERKGVSVYILIEEDSQ